MSALVRRSALGSGLAAVIIGSFIGTAAFANAAPVPREEPARATFPVKVVYADLKGEGEAVKAKLVLPAVAREPRLPGKRVGLNDSLIPTQRSLMAAVALSLAAVSIVFVAPGQETK